MYEYSYTYQDHIADHDQRIHRAENQRRARALPRVDPSPSVFARVRAAASPRTASSTNLSVTR